MPLWDQLLPQAEGTIDAEQSKTTEFTLYIVKQLRDYCVMHPKTKMSYKKSDMLLNIHSIPLYLGVPNAKSLADGHFFLGR